MGLCKNRTRKKEEKGHREDNKGALYVVSIMAGGLELYVYMYVP